MKIHSHLSAKKKRPLNIYEESAWCVNLDRQTDGESMDKLLISACDYIKRYYFKYS
jgi:hypothetical protein